MSRDLTENVEGATPLADEELAGLIPEWVATRDELNQVEQENILDAILWTHRRNWTVGTVADTETLRQLHKRMFGEVWTWAGSWRTKATNIGVDWHTIPTQIRQLAGDLEAQASDPDNLAWPAPQLLARFHHRLVSIHPFPNGNGRHSRLATDLLAHAVGSPIPNWSSGADLSAETSMRDSYLRALREADSSGNFDPLTTFMWS